MGFGTFFGSHQPTTANQATALDVVTYAASLASVPQAIDPALDAVREISSRIAPGKPLSKTDEAALSKVYKTIENYLSQQDPVRKISPEELRRRVAARFSPEAIKSLKA